MNEFVDSLKERFAAIAPEVIGNYPNNHGWVTFQREPAGVIVAVFDRAFSENLPRFVVTITRENWRIVLELIPFEGMSFPASFWDEFETKSNEAIEKARQ